MNIECRTCFYFSQESGESCWPAARKLSHLQFTPGIFQGCGGGAKGSTCGKRRKWPAQKLSQTVNDFPLPFVKTGPKSYHRKTLKKWVLVNRLDWCDWWVRMPSWDLPDVTMVSEDHDECDDPDYHDDHDDCDEDEDEDESLLWWWLMVILRWKIFDHESYLVMKVI